MHKLDAEWPDSVVLQIIIAYVMLLVFSYPVAYHVFWHTVIKCGIKIVKINKIIMQYFIL